VGGAAPASPGGAPRSAERKIWPTAQKRRFTTTTFSKKKGAGSSEKELTSSKGRSARVLKKGGGGRHLRKKVIADCQKSEGKREGEGAFVSDAGRCGSR